MKAFDLFDMPTNGSALYICLPAIRGVELSGFKRLLVQMSLAAWEIAAPQHTRQALFVLDEFYSLGRMAALEQGIAQIAGFGVKLWCVLQDLNQLKQHYPKNWETFIANAGVLQVFGCADVTTLEYFSKLLGHSLVLSRATNMPTYEQAAKQAATGESWSVTTHPLLTGDEIARYFSRDDQKLRQLILRPGFRPMILQRAFYDKHELFRGKYDEE